MGGPDRPGGSANPGSLGTHGAGCSHPLEPNALERVPIRFECCSCRRHTHDSSERAGSNACCGLVSPWARRREPDLVGNSAAFEPWGVWLANTCMLTRSDGTLPPFLGAW